MVSPPLASGPLLSLLTPFAVVFTAPTFRHVLVLVSGTFLASGRRTVAAALGAAGLGEERRFTTYHRVLNHGVWSALVLSRSLEEARAHLGLETQRQWTTRAIGRSTPCLL